MDASGLPLDDTALRLESYLAEVLALARRGTAPGRQALCDAIGSGLTYYLGRMVKNQRHGWTGGFPLVAQAAAILVCCLGYALLTWAMISNRFFSQIVRIQSDRGHTVATGGPYRFFRHPGYLGMVVFEPAMSILLGSWWALLASGLSVLLVLLRTALEDRTLQAELPGYREYTRQVRYRLIPGIW